jgi:hypothetical protein
MEVLSSTLVKLVFTEWPKYVTLLRYDFRILTTVYYLLVHRNLCRFWQEIWCTDRRSRVIFHSSSLLRQLFDEVWVVLEEAFRWSTFDETCDISDKFSISLWLPIAIHCL